VNGHAQNVDFCLNVHISDLTYIWKLIVYTLGTCLKNTSWFLDMRIRIYFFDDFLAAVHGLFVLNEMHTNSYTGPRLSLDNAKLLLQNSLCY
jgi:hypothetical protein